MGIKGNKAELAHKLGVSRTTLSLWLLRYGAAFPIEARGTNGREYVFDFGAVFDFLRAKREEESKAGAERDEQLAQLALPFAATGVDMPESKHSAKDQLDAWKLRKLQREEGERCGRLVLVEELAPLCAATLAGVSRDMHAFIRQLGREHGWPDAYVSDLQARYTEVQRARVRDLDQRFAPRGAGNEDAGDGRARSGGAGDFELLEGDPGEVDRRELA